LPTFHSAGMKTETIRKTWPKIRTVEIKGEWFYQVDARRAGTSGRRETFTKKTEAEKRAAQIESDFAGNGNEGLAMSADLRAAALKGEGILAKYGKTVWQAVEFYRDFLEGKKAAEESALVETLADLWRAEKEGGKNRVLRPATLKDIRLAADLIGRAFAGQKILDVTTASIQKYLDGLNVGMQRKFNVWNLLSQFLNWCVKHEYIAKNPALKIEIEVEGKDVAIFSAAEAERILALCVERFPFLTTYHAICLFGGLRPEECQALKWEQIHLDERTITVLAETSKIKETRNVHIEETLFLWLSQTPAKDRKGYVTPQTNLTNYLLKLHVAAGYRGAGENMDKESWPQDVLRHSYGSYWLAKNGNRAQLAEYMGNSLQIIKKHYKQVVSKTETAKYWAILPEVTQGQRKKDREKVLSLFPRV
jgi:integrase